MKENANSLKDGAGAAPYEEPPEVTSRSDEVQFFDLRTNHHYSLPVAKRRNATNHLDVMLSESEASGFQRVTKKQILRLCLRMTF